MKKTLFVLTFITLTAISCSKSDPDPSPSGTEVYMNLTAGAQWNYQITNNNPPAATTPYSLTSTSRDTSLGGRQYHIFNNSAGGFEFHAISGNDYYSYYTFPDPINVQTQYLYLKATAAAGTTWEAASFPVTVPGFPFPITVKVNNTIAEKGLTKTVNGTTYTNVIHVTSAVTVPGVPGTPVTSNIHTYYALKYGEIDGTIQLSSTLSAVTIDTHTQLMSANF